MKLLFATTNPAKVKKYKEELKKQGIELITANDLNLKIEVEETGKNAIENAYIKAKKYYDITKMTSVGLDTNLYIEGLPEEEQPGTHVRRVNGKTLDDDEMIEYYTGLVKKYGGQLTAKWVHGMVIYDGKDAKSFSWNKDNFYFVDKPNEKRNPGYPLDSIIIMPEVNRYFVDLTQQEKEQYRKKDKLEDVIKFITSNVKEKEEYER